MEQILLKKGVVSICQDCGRENNIPLKHFYDGFEGPFFCKFCGAILDLDIEEE
jgi:hypothetical protein